MKKIVTVILCLFIISACVSRKTKARYFEYKALNDSYAKVTDSLYASITEVSNGEYRAFIGELKITDTAKYNAYNIESFRWTEKPTFGEPLITSYFSHPAYKDYPLVNVSYEGAIAYCAWLTDNYNNNPKRQYKKVVFRLPTEAEWKIAASSGKKDMMYPWGGPYLRNYKGAYLANFRRVYEGNVRDTIINNIGLGITEIDENSLFLMPTPIKSYYPNNLGIYCMAGNVSEMLSEKGRTKGGNWNTYGGYYLRIDARDEFNGEMFEPSPLVGFRVFIEVLEE